VWVVDVQVLARVRAVGVGFETGVLGREFGGIGLQAREQGREGRGDAFGERRCDGFDGFHRCVVTSEYEMRR